MKAKRPKPIPRDPEATRKRIIAAARAEFAQHGLGGARVDRIATKARINKRMLYHYFGNKDALFRHTLEEAYGSFRAAEAELRLQDDAPVTAIKRLIGFTFDYYIAHPEFITLVNSENLHKARHLKSSAAMEDMNRAFVARMARLLKRGEAEGVFYSNLDPVQILITVAALGYHYLNNQHTGTIVYGRDLMTKKAIAARNQFNTDAILKILCRPEILSQLQHEASP